MGQSTDAILCFGVPLDNEEEPPPFMEGYDELDELLMKEGGHPRWGEPGHSFDAQREWLKGQPVEMVLHCSGDYPMYILAVRGTVTTASRGYPEEVQTTDPDHTLVNRFMSWLSDHNVEGEPKWLICSMWN